MAETIRANLVITADAKQAEAQLARLRESVSKSFTNLTVVPGKIDSAAYLREIEKTRKEIEPRLKSTKSSTPLGLMPSPEEIRKRGNELVAEARRIGKAVADAMTRTQTGVVSKSVGEKEIAKLKKELDSVVGEKRVVDLQFQIASGDVTGALNQASSEVDRATANYQAALEKLQSVIKGAGFTDADTLQKSLKTKPGAKATPQERAAFSASQDRLRLEYESARSAAENALTGKGRAERAKNEIEISVKYRADVASLAEVKQKAEAAGVSGASSNYAPQRPTTTFDTNSAAIENRRNLIAERTDLSGEASRTKSRISRLDAADPITNAYQGLLEKTKAGIANVDAELRNLTKNRALEVIDMQLNDLGDEAQDAAKKLELLDKKRVVQVSLEIENEGKLIADTKKQIAALPADASDVDRLVLKNKLQDQLNQKTAREDELRRALLTDNIKLARTDEERAQAARDELATRAKIIAERKPPDALKATTGADQKKLFEEADAAIRQLNVDLEEAAYRQLQLNLEIERTPDTSAISQQVAEYELASQKVKELTERLEDLRQTRDLAETTSAEISAPELRGSAQNVRAFATVDRSLNAVSENFSTLEALGLGGNTSDIVDLIGSAPELAKALPQLKTAVAQLIPQVAQAIPALAKLPPQIGALGGAAGSFAGSALQIAQGLGIVAVAAAGVVIALSGLSNVMQDIAKTSEAVTAKITESFKVFEEAILDDSLTTKEIAARRKEGEIRLALTNQLLQSLNDVKSGVVDRTGVTGVVADILNAYDSVDSAIEATTKRTQELGGELLGLTQVEQAGLGALNDYRQALAATNDTITALTGEITSNQGEIAKLRNGISALTTDYIANEIALDAAAQQAALFASQTTALASSYASINAMTTRQYELQDRAIERTGRLGDVLDNLVSEDVLNNATIANKLLLKSSTLARELGTQSEDVFKALAGRNFSALLTDGASEAITAALADLTDGVRSALGGDIINALEKEGQAIAGVFAEQAAIQVDYNAKRAALIKDANDGELDRLSKFLLERQRALEDFETERKRMEEDFAARRLRAILDNDVDAFLSARREGKVAIKRATEDFNTKDSRARQDFGAENAQIQANLQERLNALNQERDAAIAGSQAKLLQVQRDTDAEIAKLVERYTREQVETDKQIALDEKRSAVFATIAANESAASKALQAQQDAIVTAAESADRYAAYNKSLQESTVQIVALAGQNFLLSLQLFGARTGAALLTNSISLMEQQAMRTTAPLNAVTVALAQLERVAGTIVPASGFKISGSIATPPSPYQLEGNLPVLPLPGRALGGPVYKNKPYLVGDRYDHKPELFIPDSNGRIEPNFGGGKSVTVNIAAPQITVGDLVTKSQATDIATRISEVMVMQVVDAVEEALAS